MELTLGQHVTVVQRILIGRRHDAEDMRREGDRYKSSANEAEDRELARVHFAESSRWYAMAREAERDADALLAVLTAAGVPSETVSGGAR